MSTWLLGDGEIPEVRVGEVLHHVGLRLSCDAFGPSAEADSGAWAGGAPADGEVANSYLVDLELTTGCAEG